MSKSFGVFDIFECQLTRNVLCRVTDAGEGNIFLTEADFHTSMFELVDNFCEASTLERVVTWLNKLRSVLLTVRLTMYV